MCNSRGDTGFARRCDVGCGRALSAAVTATVCVLVATLALMPGSDDKINDSTTGSEDSGSIEQTDSGHDRPNVDEATADEASTDGILSQIAGEQRLERNFVDEINAVESALRNLETSHTSEGSGFLHDGTIEWGAEIDDLHRRLAAVEQSLAIPTSSPGDSE